MGGDSFRFKRFSVTQRDSAMKVGTDGVILGSWVSLDGHERSILDIGTGTGLIALMLAQRSVDCFVDGVEIDSLAAAEAGGNFARSEFSSRLRVEACDFQSFSQRVSQQGGHYDLIVSNPPYFDGTCTSLDAQRTAARHCGLLSSEDLLAGVMRIISVDGGRFAAIFPYVDAAVFIAKAASYGLYCTGLLEVIPCYGRTAKRIVVEFSLQRSDFELVVERLVIMDSDGSYSDHYRCLTSEFYLKF